MYLCVNQLHNPAELLFSAVSHLQLISGWWFSGCSVWWGSVALDHHNLQLPVYLRLSNKSLPVPVCLAPQIHNLLSQSALLFLFLLSSFAAKMCPPTPHPQSVYCVMRKIYETERAVFPDRCEQINGARLISHEPESDHSYRSLFSLCPLGLNLSLILQAFGWQMISLSMAPSSGKWVKLSLLLDLLYFLVSIVLIWTHWQIGTILSENNFVVKFSHQQTRISGST